MCKNAETHVQVQFLKHIDEVVKNQNLLTMEKLHVGMLLKEYSLINVYTIIMCLISNDITNSPKTVHYSVYCFYEVTRQGTHLNLCYMH